MNKWLDGAVRRSQESLRKKVKKRIDQNEKKITDYKDYYGGEIYSHYRVLNQCEKLEEEDTELLDYLGVDCEQVRTRISALQSDIEDLKDGLQHAIRTEKAFYDEFYKYVDDERLLREAEKDFDKWGIKLGIK